MCGIAGIFHLSGGGDVNRRLLTRMNESQIHRGPDAGGVHLEPGVGLAHRRLSIIDLAGGSQPLYNEDESVVVVFNGEIYNYRELGEELRQLGHTLRTQCDTEVIVHAWEEWQERCVHRFRGMFAFGLWDRNRRTLFLARDRLGIKPLYYAYLATDELVFASELKALLVHPGLSRDLDPRAVEDYFAYGYIPDPKTIFSNVCKMHPGYTLTLKQGSPVAEPIQYWDIPFSEQPGIDAGEAAKDLIHHLEQAVKIRMVAEVPLGAFLSGGVDSSAVVAMMGNLSSDRVNTCTISFGDPRYNEAEFADKVARHYNTRHWVDEVNPNDFGLIDRLAMIYDEPYADSSAIPTYRVCELAKRHVTVALSGDGGDENLAGYRRYRWHIFEERLRSLIPQSVRGPLFGSLGRIYPKADWAPKIFRAKSTLEALARNSIEGYFHSVSILPDPLRKQIFSDRFRRRLDGYQALEVLRSYANQSPTEHPLSLVQYLDMKTYLVGDILTKVDRASMCHSLEVRVPILDHLLVEWISSLPPVLKLNGREGKHLFKKALEPYLPKEVLYRPKMGFAVPLASWFRGPLRQRVRDAILGQELTESGIFDMAFLRRLLDQHQSGVRDHSPVIWSLLMFESFQRQVAIK